MGYEISYYGKIQVEPPLNAVERDYLVKFARTTHVTPDESRYRVEEGDEGSEPAGAVTDPRVENGKPSAWCEWVPSNDGTCIEWSGSELFYAPDHWLAYLIEHFLAPGAEASALDQNDPLWRRYFEHFTFDHICNGVIEVFGEDFDDRSRITVANNTVFWDTEPEIVYHERWVITSEWAEQVDTDSE